MRYRLELQHKKGGHAELNVSFTCGKSEIGIDWMGIFYQKMVKKQIRTSNNDQFVRPLVANGSDQADVL